MHLPAYTVSSVGLLPHDLLLIWIIKEGMLLSHFSRVQLCATPETAAHQAPPALGFSRQERWSELPFPSPVHESESEVAQSCLTLSDSIEGSLPGSSVHGVFQGRVLEWGAIAFSYSWGDYVNTCITTNEEEEEEEGKKDAIHVLFLFCDYWYSVKSL